jgi:hypothetical protein
MRYADTKQATMQMRSEGMNSNADTPRHKKMEIGVDTEHTILCHPADVFPSIHTF